MNTSSFLQALIKNFNDDNLESFLREKSDSLEFTAEELYYNKEKFINYDNAKLLAKSDLPDGTFIVCTLRVTKDLTERSSKKEQYELAKNILKSSYYDAGIFVFYDHNGNFRFSLIYAEYQGNKRTWNNFKRFTYFVSPHQTNKTFIDQIGNADFSTIEALKKAFSVEPVTKQFYDELQNWYFWAMDKIKFPTDYKYNDNPEKDKEIRNSNNLIRLITRIIFIWFLKQKNLINDDLFSEEKLKNIIKDFYKNKDSANYYNAILQNLFFATLNQTMNERKFAEDNGFPANKKEYGIKNLYRYEDKFLISENDVLKLFKDIPFLNGGLFDCLDKEDKDGKVVNIDGFTRTTQKQAIIPDYLFFQNDETKVNLSKYGLSKDSPVKGLIKILQGYNFTIDENTLIDQEIALDPELLGKVFENLLASYNPETSITARKATGSYYTPREIVDYMVQESLFNYLIDKCPNIDQSKLNDLLSYSEKSIDFSETEKKDIIDALGNIKILDPACGSGAFPMGALHKIVNALQKLDPYNEYWRELQRQKATQESQEVFKQNDKYERQERLKEINETFDESINYPDYARKLYLIENCIYGVDIQPIAIQISKLRFFISLVIDQKVDRNKENFGIRALPNLETKFVAANTLIGIEKPKHLFYTDEIRKLEYKIKTLRRRYFQAKIRKEKLDYQRKDRELRKLLADELKSIGYSSESSEKIAGFDLFDHNASADWFDPDWMFCIKDGFDIVIANPPYVRQERIRDQKLALQKQGYEVYNSTSDLYTYFYERSYHFLKPNGFACFISSNKWMRAKYGEKLRKFFKEKTTLKQIIDFNGYQVFDATVDTNILLFQKKEPSGNIIHILNINPDFTPETDIAEYFNSHKLEMKQSEIDTNCFTFGDQKVMNLKNKIEEKGKPLKDWDVKIYYGIKTGLNEAFIIDDTKRQEILDNCKDNDERRRTEAIIKPILRGRDIKRYYYKWAGLWVIIAKFGFYKESHLYPSIIQHLTRYEEQLKNRGQCKYNRQNKVNINNKDYTGQHHWLELDNNPKENYLKEFEKEKVIYSEIVREPQFHYDNEKFYVEATSFLMTGKHIKYICGLLNSKSLSYFFKTYYAGGGLGKEGYRYKKAFIEKLPIPPITPSNQSIVSQIESLVDNILSAKKENHAADTSEWEKEIDILVYKLYDLTDEEIKIVEG